MPATNIGKYIAGSTADIILGEVDPAKTARSMCGRQPEMGGASRAKTGTSTSFLPGTGRDLRPKRLGIRPTIRLKLPLDI
jgi:hypothetical protein